MSKLIFIIGVGGTGGLLASKLAKFLNQDDKLILVDGDKVEYKNIIRQPFQVHDIEKFKAESLAKKINSVSRFKNCYSINKFLYKEDSLFKIIKASRDYFNNYLNIVVISCVDNHKSRILIEKSISNFQTWKEQFNKSNYSSNLNLVYIDSANENNFGDILINEFRSRIYKLKIENNKELILTEKSCEELINDGVIQQFATNDQAANLILQILSKLQEYINKKYHIKFNEFNSKIESIKKGV